MKHHRLVLILAAVYVGAALPACISDADFTIGSPDGSDASPDADPACNPCPDSSVGSDGSGGQDSAPSGDTGTGGTDAGADSGTTDSGGSDAGCGPCDAGTDSGSDSGLDSGTDSGVDSGSDASIDSGSDSGSDSGVDGGIDGGGSDGGDAGDAGDGGDAGCVISTTICNGDQPMICDGTHTYVNNGGICNYGCSSGACNCNAPGGRLTNNNTVVVQDITDTVTGYRFARQTILAWQNNTYSDATSNCAAIGLDAGVFTVPTAAKLSTFISQQVTDNSCTPDHDSNLGAVNLVVNKVTWTNDSCGAGMHYTFSFIDGTTSCESDSNLHETWCVQ